MYLGSEVAARQFLGLSPFPINEDNAKILDIELHANVATSRGPEAVAPALVCVTFLTVVFFSVYLLVIFLRTLRTAASHAHDVLLPMLMKTADGLTLVPMMSILMINARQRATQLDPASGDPQPWAQSCMYVCVASLILRILIVCVEHAMSPSENSKGNANCRQCDQLSTGDKMLRVCYVLASLVLYGSCVGIVISVLVMRRPKPMDTPLLTPMMFCSLMLTVLYLFQLLVLEITGCRVDCQRVRSALVGQEPTYALLHSASDGEEETTPLPRPEDETYIKLEPVTMQFIPMYCVLLVGIGLRAVQLNLQPPKWACAAMFLTSTAILVQAILVPILRCMLLPEAPVIPSESDEEFQDAQEEVPCFPAPRKPDETRRLTLKLLCITWSLLLACLYIGISATLVSVFAMEAEPLDVVWPEKKIGLLAEFLRHLEKSRHLRENEALSALSTAAVPPISSAMRCAMLLTLLYFGVFLVLLVGRAVCGPARMKIAAVNEAIAEFLEVEETLKETMRGLQERESRDPELGDVVQEDCNQRVAELQKQQAGAKESVHQCRVELANAHSHEAQICEGVQRSLAFVPMLCIIMIAVRMRAMQVHIRDPQPWAQVTMFVATTAVSTQVIASMIWACFVEAGTVTCGELGIFGKLAAIVLLGMRYIAAACLYVAMIVLAIALVSMQ
jgi:hypothetical protein